MKIESNPFVLIMRHGAAMSRSESPRRPLSTPGRAEVAKMGAWLSAQGYAIDEIRHSGILRAEETAEILAQYLSLALPPVAVPGLEPDANPKVLVSSLAEEAKNVIVVAHLPLVYEAVYLLLGSSRPLSELEFETAGITILRRTNSGTWDFVAYAEPSLVS